MICINCGKETREYSYRRKSIGGNKYCSEKCHREYWLTTKKKSYKEKKCEICGCDFIPKSYRQKYCSSYCSYLNDLQKRSKKPKTKECKCCHKIFIPYTSLDKFCSINCRINAKKNERTWNWKQKNVQNIIGENNPAYRNGYYTRKIKKHTKGENKFKRNSMQIKQTMIDIAGVIFCEFCGTTITPSFESHHIVYRSEKPLHEHLHDKENILIVCISCHNELHKHKGLRNKIVEKRKLNELFGNDIIDKRTA